MGALTGGEVDRCSDAGCPASYELGTAERAGVGAVAGAVVGVLAGSLLTRWLQRFP